MVFPCTPSKRFSEAHSRIEYIPTFISKKPFYIDGDDTSSDYLEHQRLQKAATDQSKWYDRGKRLGPAATKFRKGACENCGAVTHKTKDCLSRPRAKGARWTGKDIQADEVVQDVELGWDAKRDRWNGYDATEYRAVIEEYEELETMKKKVKGSQADGQRMAGEDGEDATAGEVEEARYAEESDMGRQQSTATRNLRLREDTAKYLLNLDLDSAKYDPKTRSMVDMGAQADQAAALVAEDNFMRASGDAAAFEGAQKYAWESQERGDNNKTHIQANPTSGEYFLRKEKEEREAKRGAHESVLIEKYGVAKHLQAVPMHGAAVVESDKYIEYDEAGAVLGATKAIAKSKYPENVYINNHTSVWGSWWKGFQWGYACCHSIIKNSYCAGKEGKEAYEEADKVKIGGALEAIDRRTAIDWAVNDTKPLSESNRYQSKSAPEVNAGGIGKKRTLIEMKGRGSEEELEVYKQSKAIADDPMAKLVGKDELGD